MSDPDMMHDPSSGITSSGPSSTGITSIDPQSSAVPMNGMAMTTMSGRGEAAEALPWFREMMGGISSDKLILHGHLFGVADNQDAIAEHLGDKTIVTRLADFNRSGKYYKARKKMGLNAMNNKYQIGVIVGRKHTKLGNRALHFLEGEEFALMGYWIIGDLWVDWHGEKKVIMMKLDRVEEKKQWWCVDKSDAVNPPSSPKVIYEGAVATLQTQVYEDEKNWCLDGVSPPSSPTVVNEDAVITSPTQV